MPSAAVLQAHLKHYLNFEVVSRIYGILTAEECQSIVLSRCHQLHIAEDLSWKINHELQALSMKTALLQSLLFGIPLLQKL